MTTPPRYHPGVHCSSRSTKRTASIVLSSKEISISYGIPKNKAKKSKKRVRSLNTVKTTNNHNTTTTQSPSQCAREHHEEEDLEIDSACDIPTDLSPNNTLSAHHVAKHNKSTNHHLHGTLHHDDHDDHKHEDDGGGGTDDHEEEEEDEVEEDEEFGVEDDDLCSITSQQSFFFHPRNYYGHFKPKNVSRNRQSVMSAARSIASDGAVIDELELLPNMDELRMYEKQKQLGTGTDAHVYEVVDRRDKSHVAMKLTKRKSGRYRTEIHLLHQLRTCPFIVKLLKVLEDQSVYVLILEQAPMTLEMLLHERCTEKPMAEVVGREIFGDLLKGIRAIHNLGFVHKDVKPENVLIFADRIHRKLRAKIADFGFATRATMPADIRTLQQPHLQQRHDNDHHQHDDDGDDHNGNGNEDGDALSMKDSSSSTVNGQSHKPHDDVNGNHNEEEEEQRHLAQIPKQTLSEFVERVADKCGTPGFWAPELVAGVVVLDDAFKMDVFSAGVTLYRMLCNEMPFGLFETWDVKGSGAERKLNKMKPNFQVVSWIATRKRGHSGNGNGNKGDDRPKIDYIRKMAPSHLTKNALSLLRGMLRIRPHKRMSVGECLRSPWYTMTQ